MISENIRNEIKNVFPKKKSKVGRPPTNQKLVVSGILYTLTTGCQWHNLPDYYGKPTTVHGWFRIWVKFKIFDKVLLKSIDAAIQHIDSPKCFITDTSSAKAPFAKFSGKNSTDRSKMGVKMLKHKIFWLNNLDL
ncbi:transposase [Candidatus Dependentiae bacterium]|nr:transposase [Candidatus Dependentiae bacterium]